MTRNWLAKLASGWVDRKQLADTTLDTRVGVDFSNMPKCHRCSREADKRVAVIRYEVIDAGSIFGTAVPYVDVRAECHGEQETIRIENIPWPAPVPTPARWSAAFTALPFFTGLPVENLWFGDKQASKLWLPNKGRIHV